MKPYSIQFPYGSVYFRKSNPPKKDWERDYAQAAEDGINIFRHWFIWGSIEVAPGVYDWEDYDRQLALADKYGIKTIIAEITTSVPEWAAARYPELFPKDHKLNTVYPEMGVSCATGGFFTGFCLDKPAARELAGGFLQELASRYKDHSALLGYDVANECYLSKDICYCEDTAESFRLWLRKKYPTIRELNQAWLKYSYTDFSEVFPPLKPGFFEESADWFSFRRDRLQENIRWKIGRLRDVDQKNLITAHGMAATLTSYSETGCDDWQSAKNAQVYGATWVQGRKGNEPWKQFCAMDLTRCAAKEKPFWHTEAQGGPLWLQPQLYGRSREDGRIPAPEDIRSWNLISMACGAGGMIYTRHRPLLDGPLFGAFAPYAMDGGRTECSRMASEIAKWANHSNQRELFEAKPAEGEVGILFVPECETASYLLSFYGNEQVYAAMMWGAYRGFFDHNIQADFVTIGDISSRKVIYFPYPVALTGEHARLLKDWVRDGGVLISEACPGYFGDRLHAGERQPNNGLEEMFGVSEKRVEFVPDLMEDMYFELMEETVCGGGYLQTYNLVGAKEAAVWQGDTIAAVNRFGSGKTLLIGTNISYCYYKNPGRMSCAVFSKLLDFAGISQAVKTSDREIIARIHQKADKRYLWILNPSASDKKTVITCNNLKEYGNIYWSGGSVERVEGNRLYLTVNARDGIILSI